MDSKVTALERAFQLARSGRMATIDDIEKHLKREGYDERVVTEGGRSLATQLRELVRIAGLMPGLRESLMPVAPSPRVRDCHPYGRKPSGEPRKRRE